MVYPNREQWKVIWIAAAAVLFLYVSAVPIQGYGEGFSPRFLERLAVSAAVVAGLWIWRVSKPKEER